MKPIRLEDDCEPSWDDAKTRLKVAAETFGFPFWVSMDEVAYAYANLGDFIDEHEENKAAQLWFTGNARRVTNFEEALRTLYPWFHDGEELPERKPW